jgi:hypothetical protein
MDLPLLKNDITGSGPTVNMLDTLQKAQVQDIEKGRVSSTEKVQAMTSISLQPHNL